MDTRHLLAPALALLLALPATAPADPPPWAPAYGYRAKHGDDDDHRGDYECEYKEKYKKGKYEYKEKCKARKSGKRRRGHDDDREGHVRRDRHYDRDYEDYHRRSTAMGIPRGTCDKEVLGGLLGAAGGGFLGSKVGGGDGQLAATAAGTVLGYIIGSSVGRFMDDVDQGCVGQALERAPDRQTVAWTDGRRDARYEVTPTRTFRNDGRYCRDYVMDALIDGRSDTVRGTACRNPDGSWARI